MSVSNLLFTNNNGTTLYVLNGTTVSQLADASSTPSYLSDPLLYNPISVTVVGQMAYFTMADSSGTTSAIWSYDGRAVTQITSSSNYVNTTPDGNNLAASGPMAAYNGNLVFSQANLITGADSGSYDHAALAVYNPVTKLTVQPSTPNSGYDPRDFVTLGSTLYFEATDSATHSPAIYSFDGTTVTEVYNLHPTVNLPDYGAGPSTIIGAGAVNGSLAAFNGSIYFGSGQQTIYQLTATTSLSNTATNRSGGSTHGAEYDYYSPAVDPIVSGSYLYFLANNSGVWSLSTANVVKNLVGSIGAQSFTPVDNNSTLYFVSGNYSPTVVNGTFVNPTGSGASTLFSSTGTSATSLSSNFSGSDFVAMGGKLYYHNSGPGLATITGSSTLGTLTVPNAAGGDPLVSLPFAAVSWNAAGTAAPAALILAPGSDSGTLLDNSTVITTPVITGTGIAGDIVTLFDGVSAVGTAVIAGNGTWSVTSSMLATGSHTLTATQTDGTTASAASTPLILMIAAAPVAPTALTLAPASDSGTLLDQTTDVGTPAITGSGTAGDTVTLYDGGTAVGSGVVSGGGTWSVTASTLSIGSHTLTAKQTNSGGDVSIASAPLALTIAAAPTAPAALRAGRVRLGSVTLPISGSPAGCSHVLPLLASHREGVARPE